MADAKFISDEPLPGSERERERFGTFPTLASEMLGDVVMKAVSGQEQKKDFPFFSWAATNGFLYPVDAGPLLAKCESALEAYFVRGFVSRPGVTFRDGKAVDPRGATLTLQVRRGFIRIDAVLECGPVALAIELDGATYHGRKYDELAKEYLRERRIIACGYTLVRFTARDVFNDTAGCWCQIDSILDAHTKRLSR